MTEKGLEKIIGRVSCGRAAHICQFSKLPLSGRGFREADDQRYVWGFSTTMNAIKESQELNTVRDQNTMTRARPLRRPKHLDANESHP